MKLICSILMIFMFVSTSFVSAGEIKVMAENNSDLYLSIGVGSREGALRLGPNSIKGHSLKERSIWRDGEIKIKPRNWTDAPWKISISYSSTGDDFNYRAPIETFYVDVNYKEQDSFELYVEIKKNGEYCIVNEEGDILIESSIKIPSEKIKESLNNRQEIYAVKKMVDSSGLNKNMPNVVLLLMKKFANNEQGIEYNKLKKGTVKFHCNEEFPLRVKGHIEFHRYNKAMKKYVLTCENQEFNIVINQNFNYDKNKGETHAVFFNAKKSIKSESGFRHYKQVIIIEEIYFTRSSITYHKGGVPKDVYKRVEKTRDQKAVLDKEFTNYAFEVKDQISEVQLDFSFPCFDDDDDEQYKVLIEQK